MLKRNSTVNERLFLLLETQDVGTVRRGVSWMSWRKKETYFTGHSSWGSEAAAAECSPGSFKLLMPVTHLFKNDTSRT